jgi:L-ascorbate metabolism protein UlaG (beta-lactamase superfamily)
LNPVETRVGGLSLMFQYLLAHARNREETEPRTALGPFCTNSDIYRTGPASGLRVTWFGHSASLIEIDGVRVLIDPVWDERASPVAWAGPKRFFAPTIPLDELPPLDAVLISHDHYDHLGKRTVRLLAKLRPELRWVCPLGVARLLHGFGVAAGRVTELDWTQQTVVRGRFGEELAVTAVPARHFSGRSLWNRFHTLWAGYVLAGARHRVYYGADSGLWDGFAAIARDYGPFNLTLLEIGAWNSLWNAIHLGPDGAAEAFERTGGGVLMPIHWGLFNLALHDWRQPIERMEELALERGLPLFLPTPGEPTEFLPDLLARSDWWHRQG